MPNFALRLKLECALNSPGKGPFNIIRLHITSVVFPVALRNYGYGIGLQRIHGVDQTNTIENC